MNQARNQDAEQAAMNSVAGLPGKRRSAGPLMESAREDFDYTTLPAKQAAQVRANAERIRGCTKRLAEQILIIGGHLDAAKVELGHGQFGRWLAAEFGWSERTAQRFIQANHVFGGKSDTVSVLEPTAIYQLSAPSTPVEVRQLVLAKLERGERPPLAEIKAQVGEARRQVREKRAFQRKVRRDLKEGRPIGFSPKAGGRAAAHYILSRFDGDRNQLNALLRDVDAGTLLDALRSSAKSTDDSAG